MAVNYIRERNAFYSWLTMNYLSPTAQACWNALFTIYNAQGWPDGWIEAPDMLLRSYMHVSNDALLDARQQLKNKGLLDFIKGNRRASAAKYRLIWITGSDETTDSTGNPEGYPQDYPHTYPQVINNNGFCPEKAAKEAAKAAAKAAAKEADKQADKQAAKAAAKGADLYKTIQDGIGIPDETTPFSDRVKIQLQGSMDARATIAEQLSERQKGYVSWYREFDADASRVEQFRFLLANGKFTYPQLSCALTLAQGKTERGKVSNPLEYIKAVLIDWDKRGLTERREIEHDLTVDLVPTGYYGCKDWDEAHDESVALSM